MEKQSIIQFSQGNIANWAGLSKNLLIKELIELFGKPAEVVEDSLGYYPAERYDFTGDGLKEGLIAYVREQVVILIETKILPDSALLDQLPGPDIVLPHQILIPEGYAAEYVFGEKGLNLTVAKHFDKNIADGIVRCRGFEKLNSAGEFDARYYKSFEDITSW